VSSRQSFAPPIFSEAAPLRQSRECKSLSSRANHSVPIRPAYIQPFVHFASLNPSGINTSGNFPISRISLIWHAFNFTRINTSGNKDLKSRRINTSGSKDLKSLRINTSKNHRRGEGCSEKSPPIRKFSRTDLVPRNAATTTRCGCFASGGTR
jgi:hypothetical protein